MPQSDPLNRVSAGTAEMWAHDRKRRGHKDDICLPGANATGLRNHDIEPRARIQINTAVHTEVMVGKTINGYSLHGTHSGDHGQTSGL